MKICDVVLNSIWYDPRVIKQIKSYKNLNYDLVCLGVKDSKYCQQDVEDLNVKIFLAESKPSRNIFKKILNIFRVNKQIYKRLLLEKPDIIHANDLNALIPAYKAKKKLKCKLVYDSHEVFVENISYNTKPLVKKYYTKVEKKIIKHVDLMVSVSNAAKEYFIKKLNIKNIIVVTNSSNQIYEEKNIKKYETFDVLNHGQFYGGRGYDIMVHAAVLLKDKINVNLRIRGFGSMEEELREFVMKENLSNYIIDKPVKTKELVDYARKSHIGIAITEPICLNFLLSVSNKIFEYIAAGIPVIMNNIPEHRYLNDKYNFGLVMRDNSPQALADCIQEMYSDKDLYKKLKRNAIVASKELMWDKEFDKLISIYEGWDIKC